MSEVKEPKAAVFVEAKPAPKRAVVLDPQRIANAEYLRRDWVCTAEEGTTVEDVLDPGYWSHIASQLTIYDRIEVRIDSGEFLLELLVKTSGRNWAQVALLHHHDLEGKVTTGAAVGDEFEPLFKGPLRKWCVVRKADKQLMTEKLESKQLALEWMSSYERTILAR